MSLIDHFENIQALPIRQRVKDYNVIILQYNSATGKSLKKLSGCSSCVKDFEAYAKTDKIFSNWLSK